MNDRTPPLTAVRALQPRVGISACLNGEKVRYDGTSKTSEIIRFDVAPWVNLQTFCPEMAAGMGVPRPPVDLIVESQRIAAIGVDDSAYDVTLALQDASRAAIASWGSSLSAYIVKARSPSCGAGTTPLYDRQHQPLGSGNGIFVQILRAMVPQLLIVDEEYFTSMRQVRNFLQRCYARHQLQQDGLGSSYQMA